MENRAKLEKRLAYLQATRPESKEIGYIQNRLNGGARTPKKAKQELILSPKKDRSKTGPTRHTVRRKEKNNGIELYFKYVSKLRFRKEK